MVYGSPWSWTLADVVAEFDFRIVGDGASAVARYANNSNYRNDSLIRKESTCALRCAFHASWVANGTSVCQLPGD